MRRSPRWAFIKHKEHRHHVFQILVAVPSAPPGGSSLDRLIPSHDVRRFASRPTWASIS